MQGIDLGAFVDELQKMGETQQREQGSPWAPKTIGAPRTKMTSASIPNAPVVPSEMAPKVKLPASQLAPEYAQPNEQAAPGTNPEQNQGLRSMPPPNVVFGVR